MQVAAILLDDMRRTLAPKVVENEPFPARILHIGVTAP